MDTLSETNPSVSLTDLEYYSQLRQTLEDKGNKRQGGRNPIGFKK